MVLKFALKIASNFVHFILIILITIGILLSGLSMYNYFLIPSKKKIDSINPNQFPISHYSKELLFKVGRVANPEKRANYFLNFPQQKSNRIIRIGAFGGSWTYGAEVEKGQSYPAQLTEFFNQFPTKDKVEVLNFGVSGHGFPQSFFLWKEYFKKYQLDYLLLGQIGFFDTRRSIGFINPWHLYPPKGRFILKKNREGFFYLQFVNVKGKDVLTRYRNYYKLIPSWKILKYDKHYFNFWKQSVFPNSKAIGNPFYYSNLSEAEEVVNIHRILLKKMRKVHNKKIVLLKIEHDNEDNYRLYSKNERKIYNINRISVFERSAFLYRRKDHLSSLGNEIVANVYFKALTGTTDFLLKMFRCYKEETEKKEKESLIKGGDSFATYFSDREYRINKIDLVYDNKNIGELSSLGGKTNIPKGTKNLIGFFGDDDFFARGIFISLPFQLYESNGVFIHSKDGKKILLGYIFPIDKLGVFWGFRSKHIFTKILPRYNSFPQYRSDRLMWRIENKYSNFSFIQNYKEQFFFNENREGKNHLSLWIQNYKIADLKLKIENREQLKNDFTWWSVNWLKPKKAFIFLGPSHHIRHNNLPETLNSFSLQYTNSDNEIHSNIVFGWYCKKEKIPIHLELPNLNFLKSGS